jgi:hypothetical protein
MKRNSCFGCVLSPLLSRPKVNFSVKIRHRHDGIPKLFGKSYDVSRLSIRFYRNFKNSFAFFGEVEELAIGNTAIFRV